MKVLITNKNPLNFIPFRIELRVDPELVDDFLDRYISYLIREGNNKLNSVAHRILECMPRYSINHEYKTPITIKLQSI